MPPIPPYRTILADPPWQQGRGGKKSRRPNSSGGGLEYPTLSLIDIEEHLRKAQARAATDHNLFLWTIDKFLHEAETLAQGLGYRLHARLVWNKVTGIPAAFTIRYGHEYLLWYYQGRLLPVATNERGKIHSVFVEPVRRHSQKPDISYSIIERLYPTGRRLEMYARQPRPGWEAFGNELPNSVRL